MDGGRDTRTLAFVHVRSLDVRPESAEALSVCEGRRPERDNRRAVSKVLRRDA